MNRRVVLAFLALVVLCSQVWLDIAFFVWALHLHEGSLLLRHGSSIYRIVTWGR